MLIQIAHRTRYQFDHPVTYGLQRLRLSPLSGPTQRVLSWSVDIEQGSRQLDYIDHLGNRVQVVRIDPQATFVEIVASGEVETNDTAGVVGPERGPVPTWVYSKPTRLTEPGPGIRNLATQADAGETELEKLHALSALIRDRVEYQLGGSQPTTTAEEAVVNAMGVCQDHTHIFVAAARLLGVPSRYVSGYLLVDGGDGTASASHAWAEANVSGLEWVGFDVSNGISTDDRYVRVAVGRDYGEAAPVVGVRYGEGGEELDVDLHVFSGPQQHHRQDQHQQQQ